MRPTRSQRTRAAGRRTDALREAEAATDGTFALTGASPSRGRVPADVPPLGLLAQLMRLTGRAADSRAQERKTDLPG